MVMVMVDIHQSRIYGSGSGHCAHMRVARACLRGAPGCGAQADLSGGARIEQTQARYGYERHSNHSRLTSECTNPSYKWRDMIQRT